MTAGSRRSYFRGGCPNRYETCPTRYARRADGRWHRVGLRPQPPRRRKKMPALHRTVPRHGADQLAGTPDVTPPRASPRIEGWPRRTRLLTTSAPRARRSAQSPVLMVRAATRRRVTSSSKSYARRAPRVPSLPAGRAAARTVSQRRTSALTDRGRLRSRRQRRQSQAVIPPGRRHHRDGRRGGRPARKPIVCAQLRRVPLGARRRRSSTSPGTPTSGRPRRAMPRPTLRLARNDARVHAFLRRHTRRTPPPNGARIRSSVARPRRRGPSVTPPRSPAAVQARWISRRPM